MELPTVWMEWTTFDYVWTPGWLLTDLCEYVENMFIVFFVVSGYKLCEYFEISLNISRDRVEIRFKSSIYDKIVWRQKFIQIYSTVPEISASF